MNNSKNQLMGKISLSLSFGFIALFIVVSFIFFPQDTRDRLMIFDYESNYSEEDLLTFRTNIGRIEFSYPSNDPRIQVSTFPTYIIVSHDRKQIKFITDKKEKLIKYYENMERMMLPYKSIKKLTNLGVGMDVILY